MALALYGTAVYGTNPPTTATYSRTLVLQTVAVPFEAFGYVPEPGFDVMFYITTNDSAPASIVRGS